MDWLTQIAPTLATAFGGPLAGMAVSAVSKALGIAPEEVQGVISAGKLDATQVAAIQTAELELKKQAQAMNLDFAKLVVEDKKSARDMQIATKSLLPSILAVLVVGGFGTITALKVMGYAVTADPLIQDLLTTLRDGVILVLSFYFGSSASSQNKDAMLHQSTPTTS
jgi:hypothetical protein